MSFNNYLATTICGIATPIGNGGIGVIRISGPDSVDICNQIFFRTDKMSEVNFLKKYWKNIDKRKNFIHGFLIDPFENYLIDEVLIALMKRPYSYTKEDVIEIQSHSGMIILENIVKLLIRLGAHLAAPGEFTKRAFLNGRIDIAQAEAIIDLVEAKNTKAIKIANASITGELSKRIKNIRDKLFSIVTEIQAVIEFPEDVFDIYDRDKWIIEINTILLNEIKTLLENFEEARVIRDGLKIGIIGRPNVGKSSVLNALLGKDRAIVTEIPGTTRDIIEDRINIEGIEISFYDTAGIRSSSDKIEQIGINRSYEMKDTCEMILFVLDALDPFNSEDFKIYQKFSNSRIVFLINKIDLISRADLQKISSNFKFEPYFYISALKKIGIDDIKNNIKIFINQRSNRFSDSLISPNLRQAKLLKEVLLALEKVVLEFKSNLPEDIIVYGIEEAIIALGKIIGENIEPDIIDNIFANFCIGK